MSELFIESTCTFCGQPKQVPAARLCDACRDGFRAQVDSRLTVDEVRRLRDSMRFSRWERVGLWLRRFWT